MSITAVPISIRRVRAPTAANSGNGDPSCRAKWCTRKYAPSAPNSSAATANSSDWISASEAERTCDDGDGGQWPNDRNPIFFTPASSPTTLSARSSQGASRSKDVCEGVVEGVERVLAGDGDGDCLSGCRLVYLDAGASHVSVPVERDLEAAACAVGKFVARSGDRDGCSAHAVHLLASIGCGRARRCRPCRCLFSVRL